ncbi:MAG: thiamine-phosphate kinase [Phaeodactylibacter xiamenensis]|uniref:Thiamine-monophosphate kinase n=1 Tax=Phaeodactylibacter xiamenensis TaxID=1524460 RepID=A0A098SC41_9BACT|nr:thiamine-phosphate kinase [Phaeodactylibacter xiamenensis]KGE89218.1 thiamine-monophosphate kinase [Phaeodactylibacter xiamenensis]MCR9052707.1 thiamine-phosphate kinase [bacterium]
MANESNTPKRTDVNTLGEFGLIDHLTQRFPLHHRSSVKGIGDDAAVIDHQGAFTVVSTDMLVEGIHFDLMYTPLKHLGYKAVVVNLSDIYAMNAIPQQIMVSVALSNRYSVEAMEELYEGIRTACSVYNVDLIGGDTTSSPKGLVISVTAIGKGHKERLTYRNTAKVGDLICITGNLGAAYMGLQILEREKQIYLSDPELQPTLEGHDYLLERQLKPEARKDMIEAFAKADLVPTAMIDISDGLGSELFHIAKQSGVGVLLEESGVPIHEDAQFQAIDFNMDPITVALSGGEDYELLFTVDPKDLDKVKYMADIYIAGEIVPAEDGVKLNSKGGKLHDITAQGWKHFDPSKN